VPARYALPRPARDWLPSLVTVQVYYTCLRVTHCGYLRLLQHFRTRTPAPSAHHLYRLFRRLHGVRGWTTVRLPRITIYDTRARITRVVTYTPRYVLRFGLVVHTAFLVYRAYAVVAFGYTLLRLTVPLLRAFATFYTAHARTPRYAVTPRMRTTHCLHGLPLPPTPAFYPVLPPSAWFTVIRTTRAFCALPRYTLPAMRSCNTAGCAFTMPATTRCCGVV